MGTYQPRPVPGPPQWTAYGDMATTRLDRDSHEWKLMQAAGMLEVEPPELYPDPPAPMLGSRRPPATFQRSEPVDDPSPDHSLMLNLPGETFESPERVLPDSDRAHQDALNAKARAKRLRARQLLDQAGIRVRGPRPRGA